MSPLWEGGGNDWLVLRTISFEGGRSLSVIYLTRYLILYLLGEIKSSACERVDFANGFCGIWCTEIEIPPFDGI